MARSDLLHQISCRESWIKALEERLPYADGLAYSQDKQRIRTYYNEIQALKRKLQELGDDPDSL